MSRGVQDSKEFFRYLPVSKREEQWGLFVTAVGFNSIEPDADYPRRGQGAGGQMHELVRRARAVFKAQAAIPSMEKLAASLGLSATHFHRLFKEQTGLTPYQYHLYLRIERAKHMLQRTGLSIKQIANSLSFESPFHFSHAFKRKTGMSPGGRRQHGLSASTVENGE